MDNASQEGRDPQRKLVKAVSAHLPTTSKPANGIHLSRELDSALDQLSTIRKQNELYQKELHDEKEKALTWHMRTKEKEIERVQALEARRISEEALSLAVQRAKELESLVRDERKMGRQKLESLLEKERGLEKELAAAVQSTTAFSKQLNLVLNRMNFASFSQLPGPPPDDPQPPMGNVCILFTDVECSTEKWDNAPERMQEALQIHNTLLRSIIKQHRGYEVKTEGDSFMVTFSSPKDCLLAAVDIQTKLLTTQWPADTDQWSDCREIHDAEGKVIWRGLRVRAGIHIGLPTVAVDPTTCRMDYLGSPVNKAARVANMAAGGQTIVTKEFAEAVGEYEGVEWTDLGNFELKGISGDHGLLQILPHSLHGRIFPLRSAHGQQEDMEKKIENLIKENTELTRQMEILRSELAQLRSSSSEFSARFNQMTEESTSPLTPEWHDAREWNEQLDRQIHLLDDRFHSLESEAADMRSEIGKIIQSKEVLAAERDDLAHRLCIAQAEKDQLLVELASISMTPRPAVSRAPSRVASILDISTLQRSISDLSDIKLATVHLIDRTPPSPRPSISTDSLKSPRHLQVDPAKLPPQNQHDPFRSPPLTPTTQRANLSTEGRDGHRPSPERATSMDSPRAPPTLIIEPSSPQPVSPAEVRKKNRVGPVAIHPTAIVQSNSEKLPPLHSASSMQSSPTFHDMEAKLPILSSHLLERDTKLHAIGLSPRGNLHRCASDETGKTADTILMSGQAPSYAEGTNDVHPPPSPCSDNRVQSPHRKKMGEVKQARAAEIYAEYQRRRVSWAAPVTDHELMRAGIRNNVNQPELKLVTPTLTTPAFVHERLPSASREKKMTSKQEIKSRDFNFNDLKRNGT
ncbi:adenylate/guanylate cyclase domain-containing protein [Planoprotostelium fungivorum]|uniref:Adenylate/guanylate cyclase domain-containing protein n=1 Tax=Planoprotostelium fungivorum TaxID=1890364 RepID=A0A2P6NGY4_9EUKA|nr:adenylate/guanylate cyclase domain-containing protein [Planoprotostelium fungivorum]